MSNLEVRILGNFNVLLLRRRNMSSGNAARGRLSLLLVALMILPSSLAIFSFQTDNGLLSDGNRMNAIDYVLGDRYSLGARGLMIPHMGGRGTLQISEKLRYSIGPLPLYRLRSGRKRLVRSTCLVGSFWGTIIPYHLIGNLN